MGYAFSATTTSVFVDFYLFGEVLFGKFFYPLWHVQKGVCAGYFGDVEVVHKLVCEGGKIKVDGIQVVAYKSTLFGHLQQWHIEGFAKK